jgi:MFS family permease
MISQSGSVFYGWRLVVVLSGIYMALIGFAIYGATILFPLMVVELGWGRTEISLGFTAAMWVLGFSAPLAAWGINRYGARLTLFVGSLLAAIGCFLMQFGTTVPLFIGLYGVLVGLGLGLAGAVTVQTVVTHWFSRHRGMAIGIVMAGGGLGGLIAPSILTGIIRVTEGNWRTGWLTLSLVMVASAVASILFVRNKPSELGQYPDGVNPEEAKKAAEGICRSRVYQTSDDWGLSDAIRTHQFWLVVLAVVASFAVWQVLVSQGPLHLTDRGFTPEHYSLIHGAAIGFSIIGRLAGGFLADRIEMRMIFLAAIVSSIIGSVLFWFIQPGNVMTYAYPVFSGIGLGAVATALPNIVGNYWGAKSFASITGAIFPIFTVFNGLSPMLAGIVYDANSSYLIIMIAMWVILATALIGILFIHPPIRRKPKE